MTKPTIRPVWSKDADQPVHLPSLATVFVYFSLDSPEAVEGTCSQQRLIRLCGCAWYLSLRWSQKSYCRFCHALANISILIALDKTGIK